VCENDELISIYRFGRVEEEEELITEAAAADDGDDEAASAGDAPSAAAAADGDDETASAGDAPSAAAASVSPASSASLAPLLRPLRKSESKRPPNPRAGSRDGYVSLVSKRAR
jgi:MoxR-like ATPase